eukprot:TRINITY_DN0_c0_g1_i2.p1 TRINITY_DN0_c0_g1~~TRINITY_DN0_c0_g1_i2.p1  ORF type:complete len:1657 (+),score=816.61 TRINITY_DN0_c0_g1_i2:133-4971(+)
MAHPLHFATFWGYGGSRVAALRDGDICYPVGSALVFGNVHSGRQQYLWNERSNRPVGPVAFNARQTMFCFAEQGHEPNLYVHSYPDMREVMVVPKGTTLEYSDLAFSRNGLHFAALGGLPDFNLSVFNVDAHSKTLKLLVRTSAAAHQAKSVSFNPCSKDELVTTGSGHISFWKTEKSQGQYNLASVEGKLANHQIRITSHCHAPNGDSLGGSNHGDIYRFDSVTGFGEAWWESPGGQAGGRDAVVALAVTRHHVAACSLDGLLRFFRHESRQIERTIQFNTGMARSISLVPEWNGLVLGCGDGLIFNLHLPGYDAAHLAADDFRAMRERVWPVCDFCGGAVASLCHLQHADMVASVSEDCTMRVWDYRKNALLSKTEVGQRPSCCSCGSGPSGHLVAVGSETAHLRIMDVSDPQRPKLVLQERLCEQGALSVCRFSADGTQLACAVDGVGIFFVDLTGEPRVLGFVACADSVCKDLLWVDGVPDQLLTAHANGDIRHLVAPSAPPDDEETGEYPSDLFSTLYKLDFPVERMRLGKFMEEVYQLVVLSRDKETKVYQLDKSQKPGEVGKVSAKKPSSAWKDHEKVGTAVIVTADKQHFWTAGSDGKIVMRDITNRTGAQCKLQVRKHSMFTTSARKGGIADMVSSPDGKYLITGGGDGNIGVWTYGQQRPASVPFSIVDQPELVEVGDEEHVYLTQRRLLHEQMLDVQYKSHRDGVIRKIAELREQLQAYKQQNREAAPEEKLDVGEFMIQSQREELHGIGDEMCLQKEDEIKWQNLTHMFLRDRIEQECYSTMKEHLMVMKTVREKPGSVEVPNYNMLKANDKELSVLKKVKFLRRVEKLEWQRKPRFDMLEDLKEEPPADSEEAAKAAKEREEQEAKAEADRAAAEQKARDDEQKTGQQKKKEVVTLEEEARAPLDGLLYNKYLVFTRARILTQMRLLERQICNMQHAFNAEAKDLLANKKQALQNINDTINKKIRQIQKELQLDDPVPDAKPSASEKPERILAVAPTEIKAKRHLSPEEQKKFEEEQRKEAARLAESEDGSVSQALIMMMDGRLERDERQVKEIKMPTFGVEGHKDYKALEEWTDDEQRLWAEYKKKVQKQQEEEHRHRQELTSELKDLRKQLAKCETEFDGKLQALFEKKLNTDGEIYQLELQIIKLSQSIVQQEEMEGHAVKLAKIVEDVEAEAVKSAAVVADSHKDLQDMGLRFDDLANNEKRKTADKDIRAIYPFCDADDFCDILIKMLRKTRPKTKGKRERKERKEEQVNPDPFAWVDDEEEEKRKKAIVDPQDAPKLEKPEGLRDDLWREFLEFRLERMQAERDLKVQQDELTERRRQHEKVMRESKLHQQKVDQQLRMLQAFRTQMLHESYNLDILHIFKQGQIEVEQEAVVTDYADAILIHNSDIERLNEQIRDHGKGKVFKMKEMMDFKKDIRLIEWENEMLAHQREHYEMDLRHLHTLRVTKAMQEFIKGGQENHHEIERAKLVKKIEHVQKTMQGKIDEKKLQMLKVKRIIREKESENRVLEDQVKEAQQLVGEREEIQHLQSTGLDHQRNLKLMKDMRVTRKLEDVAKAQQQEMQLLKKEIDRLRERTFPSFAVVSKRVVGNPDQAA